MGKKWTAAMVLPISASAWMVVNGCGNSAFTSASSDAATMSDVAPVDAAIDTYVPPAADAGACNLDASFQTPTPLSLNVGSEIDQTARLTPDELVIYYQASIDAGSLGLGDAGDAGTLQLYTATRNHIVDPWSARSLLPSDINGVGRVSDPSVSGDNLQIYFSTSVGAGDAGPAISIYTSTRASTASSFVGAAPVVFSGMTFSNTTQPYVLSNNLTIYFRGVAAGSSTSNAIFRATRGSVTSSFMVDTSSTTALATVNATAGVSLPVVSEDELTIYFTSGVSGARNVSVATRASTSEPFGPVSQVNELNGYSVDEGSWISEDGCRLYLSSNADGNTHLYVATKPAK